jgi:hypothetical protein
VPPRVRIAPLNLDGTGTRSDHDAGGDVAKGGDRAELRRSYPEIVGDARGDIHVALGSSPNPGVVGEDAMRAIEDNPRHADDSVTEEQAELEAEKAGVPQAGDSAPAPARRSWLDRLLGRGG